MATTPSTPDNTVEYCSDCGRETSHRVRVEIRTESQKTENAEFSREPYRLSRCVDCGAESTMRMNNA
jgi:DNA-directed RNA polymerase subunit RPC12/RpoP